MPHKRYHILLIVISIGWCVAGHAMADRIFLKDGAVEESDRIWESENHVHFILKGTRSVEVRYGKEIVARIERKVDKRRVAPAAEPPAPALQPDLTQTDSVSPQPKPNPVSVTPLGASTKTISSSQLSSQDRRLIESNKGMTLYDPRRPKRYWASSNSQHATLNGAIEALSKQYERPSQWVLDHIGNENDLGIIHEQLSRCKQSETSGETAAAPQEPQRSDEDLFHDAKRTPAYAIGSGARFESLKEALDELARQYNQTPQWVENHMGSSNRISQIRDRLAQSASAISTKATELGVPGNITAEPMVQIPKGIQFYDPRRPEKYWATPNQRYRSLSEALGALAEHYGMPVEWIEAHIGDTNELSEVHQNIQNSLKQ